MAYVSGSPAVVIVTLISWASVSATVVPGCANSNFQRSVEEHGDGCQSQLHPYHRKRQKEQVTTTQERRPTGICPGTPSLQHLHLWAASHHLQKVCICWRPSNHACWWRLLAGSGRGADRGHGNRRRIPPDLEAKAHHYKTQCQEFSISTTRKLNVSWKSTATTKPCPSAPSPNTSE